MARKMKCDECKREMKSAETMYNYGLEWLCGDCLMEKVSSASADALAELMNLEVAFAIDLIDDEIPFMLSGGMYERN